RRRFLTAFPPGFELALAWQVHGDVIRMVEKPDDVGDSEIRADAVASQLPHVLAAVKTADCVPVLLGDAATGAFAAVHAGWRGTAARIVEKAFAVLSDKFGTRAEDVVAVIGPAALCRRYEIGADVMEAFAGHDDAE